MRLKANKQQRGAVATSGGQKRGLYLGADLEVIARHSVEWCVAIRVLREREAGGSINTANLKSQLKPPKERTTPE